MFPKLNLDELKRRHEVGTLVGPFNVTHEDYHAGPGVSRSSLIQILQCPAYYKYASQHPNEPTTDMQFGSAVHCRLLEPQDFELRYAKAPDVRRGTKSWAEFEKLNEGKVILTEDEWTRISAIGNKATDHQVIQKMLSGHKELALYWKDPITGLICKCKPDALNDLGVVDVKTTSYMGKEEFSKEVANQLYHMQAAFYLDGIRLALEQAGITEIPLPQLFTFLAVGKKEPFLFAGYILGKDSIDIGRSLYKQALATLKKCNEENYYPEYLDQKADNILIEIEVPPWARRRNNGY